MREIVAIPGRVEQGVVEIEPIFVDSRGRLEWVGGYPPHLDRFAERGLDLSALLEKAGQGS